MKKFSKILSVALLVALVLSLGVANAFADGETPVATPVPTAQVFDNPNAVDSQGKYTVSVATGDTHSYAVYQVLTGTLVAGENSLGNPQWGANATAAAKEGSVNDFITGVTGQSGNAAVNEYVAQFVDQTSTPIGTATTSNPVSVDPGYYLIVDTTAEIADGDARSLNIVAVFNDITITPKKGTTTSDKKVDDKNDSTGSEDTTAWQDSADYDIGDSVPFRLHAKIAADYANYTHGYKLVFHDKMEAGLTFDSTSVKVYVGSIANENIVDGSKYTVVTADTTPAVTDGDTFDVIFANLNDVSTVTAGSDVYVTFSATLNKDAVTGSTGNKNVSHITYNNNPNDEQGGEGKTPDDTVIVFTYKTVFNKVDGATHKPLTGADFELYKFIKNEEGTETYKNIKGNWTKVTDMGSGENKPSKTVETYKKTVDGKEETAANAKFTFSGLDDGYYKLVETHTPDGYNTLADVFFTITAGHTVESQTPALESLSGTDEAEFTMTPDLSEGSLTAPIDNNKGAVLPSTGGIGTTIFYVVGGVLVLAAIILLVTKKRMSE